MSSRSNHLRLLALEKQMAIAAAAMDFEAAALRNEIAFLNSETVRSDADGGLPVTVNQPPPRGNRTEHPGAGAAATQGLGEAKKPDLMTKNTKPRGGR
ncbi:MAG: hypothetical protein MO846_03030 [Candidatus Devosia symbiotica]|nr:hypothetical protein [Candidatus Devosia symbiotica]